MNGNILIVDDEPGALKLLKDILNAKGYHVRPFNNGALALRSIEAEAPELILLDMRMPGMDGLEVCRRIKADEHSRDIPVIFISAATDVQDKINAFQAGGGDYITKPFQKEEVLARVKVHVSLHRSMREIKRIDEALRKSEAQLKMAQAVAHLGRLEWDLDTGRIALSEEVNRIFGLDPPQEAISYDDFLQIVHPDDRACVAGRPRKALQECAPEHDCGCEWEYRITLPDGGLRVVQSKGKCFHSTVNGRIHFGAAQNGFQGVTHTKILEVVQDITKRKELEWQLEQQANTDSLTGCHNRRRFLELAEQEFARLHRYGNAMSLLMLDLDYFKRINDAHGHAVGDLVLKKLVKTCTGILRTVDVLGRLGGEEFAVMLPETAAGHALEVAERLRDAIAGTEIASANTPAFHFTASIGVASADENDASVDEIIKRADQALYKAKHAGRNKVCA